MHVHILGLGAVGTLIAHHIRRALPAEHTVTLIHKTAARASQLQHELDDRLLMEHSGVPVPSTGFTHELYTPTFPLTDDARRKVFRRSRGKKIQTLVVCVKAHQTLRAVGALYPRITPRTTIVLVQNGMGTMEWLNARLFTRTQYRPNFVLGVNTHGAWAKGYGRVVHAGIGELAFGVVPPEYNPGGVDFERTWRETGELSLEDIVPGGEMERVEEGKEGEGDERVKRFRSLRETVALLTSLKGLNVSWKPMSEVQMMMQRKLVVNSVINPLTALMDCPNGALFKHREASEIAMKVCSEASNALYRQHQREVEMAKFVGAGIGYKPFPRGLLAHALMHESRRVAEATGKNYSSMLMDVREGKETEIHNMNGYLVRLGSRYGLAMQVNRLLVDLVGLRSGVFLTSQLLPGDKGKIDRGK